MHNSHNHLDNPADPLSMTTAVRVTNDINDELTNVLIEPAVPNPSTPPSNYAFSHSNEDFSDFTNNNNNQSLVGGCVKYLFALCRMLVVEFLLNWTSADNTSLVSKLLRCVSTLFSYAMLYTTLTGHLLWGIAYLMDHGWYLLAASGSVTLLLLSSLFLTSYEWMWRWQEHFFFPMISTCCRTFNATDAGSMDYVAVATTTTTTTNSDGLQQRRRRPVIIHDEEGMDDDLSVRGWLKRFTRIFGVCCVWLLYCIVNIKVDFWITDQYTLARPEYHPYELKLLNCVEASPILFGAALLLCVAYPAFYRWHDAPPMIQDGIIAIAQVEEGSSGNNLEG
jgi:hypothetical protein